ncbi:MAG: hypothetical protein WB014_12710 [Methanosarcina sp.]
MRLAEIGVPTLVLAGALDYPEVLRAADLLANEVKEQNGSFCPIVLMFRTWKNLQNLIGLCLIS